MFSDAATEDFFRARLDHMIDLRHPLVVLASRMPWQQIEASVVILQFQTEAPANDGYPGNVHLLYGTIGTGPAKIFQGGKVVEGTWEKENREARTVFMDDDGNEIKFYPGKIWVETLPLGNAVTIE